MASIDAHKKLGIEITGERRAALDVADEGRDKNAFCARRGILLEHIAEWTGKESDIFETVQKAFHKCDVLGLTSFDYDADGIGSGVRGDARILNDERKNENTRRIEVYPFRGSGEILHPKREFVEGRKNKDLFSTARRKLGGSCAHDSWPRSERLRWASSQTWTR